MAIKAGFANPARGGAAEIFGVAGTALMGDGSRASCHE
jgi:hypothetical protein